MNIVKDLWIKPGLINMPDGNQIPVWGYTESQFAQPQIPGPVIEATVGDIIQINLINMLTEAVSMIFPGQNITPTPVKDSRGIFISYSEQAEPNGGTVSYTFTAERPGIFLYESGSSPYKQIQMGMYGVIIIRPADYTVIKTAYGGDTGTEFDVEQIMVLNEVDSQLHFAVSNLTPFDFQQYNPDYWTINGRSYPHTTAPNDSSSQPYSSKIAINMGQKLLIRYINAGFQNHNIRLDHLLARIVAVDSVPLYINSLDKTYNKNTITIAPGESYDIIAVVNSPGKYIIYERSYNYSSSIDSFTGNAATVLEVN